MLFNGNLLSMRNVGLTKSKSGSARLICPVCGHEHVEADRRWMNINGAWKHKFQEMIDEYPTFQCGALCSQLKSMNWDYIAQQALDAGKTADLSEQMNFDNRN